MPRRGLPALRTRRREITLGQTKPACGPEMFSGRASLPYEGCSPAPPVLRGRPSPTESVALTSGAPGLLHREWCAPRLSLFFSRTTPLTDVDVPRSPWRCRDPSRAAAISLEMPRCPPVYRNLPRYDAKLTDAPQCRWMRRDVPGFVAIFPDLSRSWRT